MERLTLRVTVHLLDAGTEGGPVPFSYTLRGARVGSVAIRAILGRGIVEQDRLASDIALQRVAHRATHIRMAACQRELSAFVVVKHGGRPPLVHMAIRTFCDPSLGNKLAAVRIAVARFAIRGRSLELDFVGTGGHFVAFITCDSTMSSDQGEFCF